MYERLYGHLQMMNRVDRKEMSSKPGFEQWLIGIEVS